jgi:hypothetical protein
MPKTISETDAILLHQNGRLSPTLLRFLQLFYQSVSGGSWCSKINFSGITCQKQFQKSMTFFFAKTVASARLHYACYNFFIDSYLIFANYFFRNRMSKTISETIAFFLHQRGRLAPTVLCFLQLFYRSVSGDIWCSKFFVFGNACQK